MNVRQIFPALKKIWLQNDTWSGHQDHNIFEFLVSVVPNSRITSSKIYTRMNSDKAIILLSYF